MCEVWCVKCEVWSVWGVKCKLWGMKCEVWGVWSLYLHGVPVIVLPPGTEVWRGRGASTSTSTCSSQAPHVGLPAVKFPVVLGLVPVHEADPPPVGDGGHQGRGSLIVRGVSHHWALLTSLTLPVTDIEATSWYAPLWLSPTRLTPQSVLVNCYPPSQSWYNPTACPGLTSFSFRHLVSNCSIAD